MERDKWIPSVWAREADIGAEGTGTTRLVLFTLASYMADGGDAVWRSESELMDAANLRPKSWRDHAKRLVDAGVLTRNRRHRADGTLSTWEYRPVRDCATRESRSPESPRSASDYVADEAQPRLPIRPDPGPLSGSTQVAREGTTEVSSEVSEEVSEEVPALDASLAALWGLYPRRVGKPAARKALKAALKDATLDEILLGLRPWIDYWEDRDEPEYVPHPSTWLNQQRWNDLPPAAPGHKKPKIGKGVTQSALERLAALSPDTNERPALTGGSNDTE